MTKAIKSNIVAGVLEYRQFIVLEDGTEVRVRYNQDPALYAGTDTTLYSYSATEGKGDDKKTVTRYAVDINDAVRATRSSAKATLASILDSGLTADEIVAKLAEMVK